MSEKRYPDRNQQPDSEYHREPKPDHAQHRADDDLRLWGSESEEENTEYGDLRDQGFKAGSTSQPGSLGEDVPQKHGWLAEEAPLEEEDTRPGNATRQQREQALERPDNDRSG